MDPQPADSAARPRAPTPDAAGPCPDALALARLAEGRALPEERGSLLQHTAWCSECQGLIAVLTTAPAARRAAPAPPRSLRRLALVAALLVLGTTAALWWVAHTTPGIDPEQRLLAVAADLERSEPLLHGFTPLARAERLLPPTKVERGGSFALLAPLGTVLEPQPGFRWEDPHGLHRWQVTLLRPDGAPVWTETVATPSCPWPAARTPLPEGSRWLWEVKGEGPLGPEQAQGAFTVATAAERTAFASQKLAISERAPRALRDTLTAHLALRRGLTGTAEALLRTRLMQAPGDVVARETLYCVLRQLGAAEADTLGVTAASSGR